MTASGLATERPVTCAMMVSTGLMGLKWEMKNATEQPQITTATN
jgi:hypothetical protein